MKSEQTFFILNNVNAYLYKVIIIIKIYIIQRCK